MESLDLEDNWLKDAGCRHVCKMMLDNDNIHDMVSQIEFLRGRAEGDRGAINNTPISLGA